MLRSGFDVRTVQYWMGHKSLETNYLVSGGGRPCPRLSTWAGFIGNSSYRICGEHDLTKHLESSQSETQARKVFVYFCRVVCSQNANRRGWYSANQSLRFTACLPFLPEDELRDPRGAHGNCGGIFRRRRARFALGSKVAWADCLLNDRSPRVPQLASYAAACQW
jgi:hypothetical protein